MLKIKKIRQRTSKKSSTYYRMLQIRLVCDEEVVVK